MKKSLLLTNLLFCVLVGSCQSTPKPVTTNESKPSSTVTPINSNSPASSTSSASQGSTSSTGIKKDTTKIPVKGKAINHSAPEQAKIDSLKKVKTKNKLKKK